MLGKRRRKDALFPGSSIILSQSPKTVHQRRIGVVSVGPVLRKDSQIIDNDGAVIGMVTSGCPSPTLGSNIAMAYISRSKINLENCVNVMVRKNVVQAVISKLPFVKCNYYFQS